MQPSSIVVQFVVTKAIIIEHEFAFKKYLLREDIAEILSWSEIECFEILNKIRRFPTETRATCPWCSKYKLNCEDCTYGKRHGKCGDLNSDFYELGSLIYSKYGPIGLTRIPEMERSLSKILEIPVKISYEIFSKRK